MKISEFETLEKIQILCAREKLGGTIHDMNGEVIPCPDIWENGVLVDQIFGFMRRAGFITPGWGKLDFALSLSDEWKSVNRRNGEFHICTNTHRLDSLIGDE